MKARVMLVCIATAVFVNACKKEGLSSYEPGLQENAEANVMALSGVPLNSVFTVAGVRYTTGPTLVDGPANIARFKNPFGMQLMDDGTIYVADKGNNIIRIVNPSGVVSSFNVPNPALNNPVYMLHSPENVGITSYGVVFTIDHDPESQRGRFNIYKPAGDLITATWNDYYDARDLVKDPYNNTFWTISGPYIWNAIARKSSYYFNWDILEFDNNYLPDSNPGYFTFPALYPGYNGVIYFTYKGKLYKHTKDNKGAVIFPNITFTNITCIVVNKDGRTLYIADNGYIKRIDEGKLITITGPNHTYTDSRDGIGAKADVNAQYLALSKDESTIYFSDTKANTIRKIIVR